MGSGTVDFGACGYSLVMDTQVHGFQGGFFNTKQSVIRVMEVET
jgi:hypothetical protein